MVSSTPPVFSPAIPLYARRVVRVYVVIPLVALGTITAAWFLGVGGLGRSPAVLVVAGIGVFAVSHGALLWYAIRLRRRLMRARGHICTQCGYELAGLAEQGRCPECGTEYHLDRVAAAWATWGYKWGLIWGLCPYRHTARPGASSCAPVDRRVD